MSLINKTICDHCEKEIKDTDNNEYYEIVRQVPYTEDEIDFKLPEVSHFHNLDCLTKYVVQSKLSPKTTKLEKRIAGVHKNLYNFKNLKKDHTFESWIQYVKTYLKDAETYKGQEKLNDCESSLISAEYWLEKIKMKLEKNETTN